MPHEHRLCVLVDAEMNTAGKPWLVVDLSKGRAVAVSCHATRETAKRWFLREFGAGRISTMTTYKHVYDPGIVVVRDHGVLPARHG